MVTLFERGIEMLSKTEALQFAHGWVRAWNSHDLDAVMSHYAPEVVLTSPTAAKLLGDPSGTVAGKEAVRSYFARGLEAFPNLTFELLDVMWGVSSVVLYYVNQKGTKTGEFMEFDVNQKVFRVVANYT
jgi:ketosteroid isomerase-like protein